MVQQGRTETGGQHEETQPGRLHQVLGPMVLPWWTHTTFSSLARVRQPASINPGVRCGSALGSLGCSRSILMPCFCVRIDLCSFSVTGIHAVTDARVMCRTRHCV